MPLLKGGSHPCHLPLVGRLQVPVVLFTGLAEHPHRLNLTICCWNFVLSFFFG